MKVKITIEVDGQKLTREYIVEKTLDGTDYNNNEPGKEAEEMFEQLINQKAFEF